MRATETWKQQYCEMHLGFIEETLELLIASALCLRMLIPVHDLTTPRQLCNVVISGDWVDHSRAFPRNQN